MKKLLSLLTAVLLLSSQAIFSSLAFALDADSIAPNNSIFFLELDPSQEHPLKGELEKLIQDISLDEELTASESIILHNMETSKLGVAQTQHKRTGEDIYFLIKSISEEDFNEIINNYPELDETMIGTDSISYQEDEDMFFGYYSNSVLLSNTEGIVFDFVTGALSDNSLSLNESYQSFDSEKLENSFLNIFINIAAITELDEELSTISYIDFEGISIQQNENGYQADLLVKFDESSEFEVDTFMPELYKSISAEGLIFFQESYNFQKQIDQTTEILGETDIMLEETFEEVKTITNEEFGLDLENDILSLFNQRIVLAVHDHQEMYPALSLISEVSNNAEATIASELIIEGLKESIKNNLQEDYDLMLEYSNEEDLFSVEEAYKMAVEENEVSINGSNLNQLIIYPDKATVLKDAYSPVEEISIKITTGVTNDNLFVFTIHNQPENIFSDNGLMDDDYFSENYQADTDLTSIAFLNFDNLETYLVSLGDNFFFTSESVSEFLGPLNSLFATSDKINDSLYHSSLSLNGDTDLIKEGLSAFIEEMSTITSKYQEYDYNLEKNETTGLIDTVSFSDVEKSDWFYDYVENVKFMEIMNGYQDGTFRPNKPISRAEFVKTIVLAEYGSIGIPNIESANFTDVSDDDWFSFSVKLAAKEGLITGYQDGTFRPNQSISRAEAATIISRLGNLEEDINTTLPFNDVSTDDWFYDGVKTLYDNQIINGKTTFSFAPADNLTRAETAKIVDLYLSSKY
ncbi:DUF3352 domain-containing protein [Candidatus Peregrinibacteria bacterium]|nr:DUF3352 domain-containing protein [Candidatus Peregrinibacteria bacterium]